jgi:DNA gyrase subunit A
MLFTQSGRVFQLRVHEVPGEALSEGNPINNLIDIGPNERITSVFVRPEEETEAHYTLMVTKNGYIKKTALRGTRTCAGTDLSPSTSRR